ncbi:MAG: protein kinase [Thermoguttaceae bacterium]|nr:protein kinase [Thermoguttaceae bacterium]
MSKQFLCPSCQRVTSIQTGGDAAEVVCTHCGKVFRIRSRENDSKTTAAEPTDPLGFTLADDGPFPIQPGEPKTTALAPPSEEDREITLSRIQAIARISQEQENAAASSPSTSPSTSPSGGQAGKPAGRKIWTTGQTLLGGKYRVVELAPGVPYAEGGVGIVHRVHHEEWDIDFAVKSPKAEFMQTEQGKLSFERECQLWIELGLHTNIVTCYLIRRIDGIPRVFAEFVSDGTLRDWTNDGRLYEGGPTEALRRIIDISIQFARGLDHAHSQGLLHLDVKPGNVMISRGVAKVTDFGLSQAVHRSDKGEPTSGICDGMTPSYCSPEQYEAYENFQTAGQQGQTPPEIVLTRQSDIWSWAISVLSMFHGRSPCKKGGQTAAEVFEVFLKVPPAEGHPSIPPQMVQILRRCFRKDPEQRPESMGQVADELVAVYEDVFGQPYPRPKPASNSNSAESSCNRAISLLDLGKNDEAYTEISKAVEMAPWHPQVTFDQVLMSWRFGIIDDLTALEAVTELARHNRCDAQSHYALGLIQRERGNPRAALVAFQRAVELEKDRVEFVKALKNCRLIVDQEAACVATLSLRPLEITPRQWVYISPGRQFIFYPLAGSRFELRHTLTGTVSTGFRQVGHTEALALSDDYLWQVLQDGEDALVKHADFPDSIPQDSPLRLLPAEERFRRVDWGRKDDAVCPEKGIRLTINGNQVDRYDERTGQRVLSFKGHQREVTALKMSRDGKWAATGSFDSSLRLWQVETGRCVRTFRGISGTVGGIWIDDDHRFLMTLVQGTQLRIWNVDLICSGSRRTRAPFMICLVSTSEEVARRQNELNSLVESMRVNVASGNIKGAVEAFKKAESIDGWQSIRSSLQLPELLGRRTQITGVSDTVPALSLLGHEGAVTSVALSADGSTAVTAGKDQVLCLWNFPREEPVTCFTKHYDWIRSVDMNRSGRFAVSGSWDRSVRIWDLQQKREIRALEGSIRDIEQVKIAPDGSSIAVAASTGEISFWDGSSGRRVAGTSIDGEIYSIRFSMDGRYLIIGGNGRLTILSCATLEPAVVYGSLTGAVKGVDISADLRWALAGDASGNVSIFDLTSEKTAPVMVGTDHVSEITSLRLLMDNRHIITTSRDRTVRVWEIGRKTSIKTLEGYISGIGCQSVDFYGSILLTGTEIGRLRLWNLFWEYDLPDGPFPNDDFERMLHCVVGRYLRASDIIARRRKPTEFYGVTTEIAPNPLAFEFSEKQLQKIAVEMQLRGFGTVPRDRFFQALGSLLGHWPGYTLLGR